MKIKLCFLSLLLTTLITKAENNIDYIDQYNVIWNSPSANSCESMPVGGGDIGCNVWVENGELLFYTQRSGSFTETGEYAKMGRVRLQFSPNPFTEENTFKQELVLRDGHCELLVTNPQNEELAKITFWVDVFNPVVHVDMQSKDDMKVKAYYESWRLKDKILSDTNKGRFGTYNFEGWPGTLIKRPDCIQHQDQGVLFYHKNPEKSYVTEVLAVEQGLSSLADKIKDPIANRIFGGYMGGEGWIKIPETKTGTYSCTDFTGFGITSEKAAKNHQLLLSTEIATHGDIKQWEKSLMETHQKSSAQAQENKEKSEAWWHQMWDRSHICITPSTDKNPDNKLWEVSRNYQVFRYQLACNEFGKYPTKFNGGNFTSDPAFSVSSAKHDPDWRQWGGDVFTSQNQRLLYWPMLKSGDFDSFLSQINLYTAGLETAKMRVKYNFGHGGASFCEYANEYGLEIGSNFGWRGTGKSCRGTEVPFGSPHINGVNGFGKDIEKGIIANNYTSYHWESQVEHAFMIMEYHRFTGKSISRYIPFIKEALIFFDEHYRARQQMRNGQDYDEKGKLVFFPSTACETYRGASNPTDLTQGIRACIERLLELGETYLTKDEIAYFADYLTHLPDIPFGEIDGKTVVKAAENYIMVQNIECPHFYPLFPFDRFACDDKMIEIFRNTWKLTTTFPKNMVQSWHQDGIFYARMRMVEDAQKYNVRKMQNSSRRFPTYWGPGHDWVPDHNWGGSGMIGFQEMLMQTQGQRIILLPCWPKDWDVDFKLHAPQNTVVECSYIKGKVNVKVTPQSRAKDIEIFIDK